MQAVLCATIGSVIVIGGAVFGIVRHFRKVKK